MQRTTLHLETVTPCFLGGAEQERVEWRGASIRGQLRWWFRALAGGAFGGNLQQVRRAEAEVFGSTERRSPLAVQALGAPGYWPTGAEWPFAQGLKAPGLAQVWRADSTDPELLDRLAIRIRGGREIPTDTLQYLAYGCLKWDRGLFLERSCLAPGQSAQVVLQWSREGPQAIRPDLERLFLDAVWAWLHLGGLASKARNGFGSFRCTGCDGLDGGEEAGFRPAGSRADLAAGLERLLASYRGDGSEEPAASQEPRWSHFGPGTTVHLAAEALPSWHDALGRVGAWLVAYRRRYGSPKETRRRGGRPIANRDYTWGPRGASNRRGDVPDRAGFGLPLPFGQGGEIATWWVPGGEESAPQDHRRASPLLIHVAKVDEGFLPVLTHVPAQLIPDGAELAYTGHRNPRRKPNEDQTGIVVHFLEDLAGKGLVRKVTP